MKESGNCGKGGGFHPYFARFSGADLERIKAECRDIAADVRVGRIVRSKDLIERLPIPVLFVLARTDAARENTGDEMRSETVEEEERLLREYAAEVSKLWRTSEGPVGEEGEYWSRSMYKAGLPGGGAGLVAGSTD